MRDNRKSRPGLGIGRRFGFSLVEVVVATIIFVIASIPIYLSISAGADKEVESTKLAMARKILESFRAEIMSQKKSTAGKGIFETISDAIGQSTSWTALTIAHDNTDSEVRDFQRKYKDFEFSAEARVNPDSPTKNVLDFRGKVTWTRSKSDNKHPEEQLLFLLVKPQ